MSKLQTPSVPKAKKPAPVTLKPVTVKATEPTKAQLAKAKKLFGTLEPEATPAPVKSGIAFSAQQLTQVPPVTPPVAIDAFNAELAALKLKHGITAKVKITVAKEKIQQNGLTRPSSSSLCGRIWNLADELSKNGTVAIAVLRRHPEMMPVNDHTIKTQYARWRQFNGITGRTSVVQEPSVVGEYEGMPVLTH